MWWWVHLTVDYTCAGNVGYFTGWGAALQSPHMYPQEAKNVKKAIFIINL